jgi:hypothetical protein
MRILLDECIDEALRHALPGNDCQTCRYAGLKGVSNGHLLDGAEKLGFEVLITVDRNLPYQQRLPNRKLAVVVLRARTTNFEDPLPLMARVQSALDDLKPGDVLTIADR